MVRKIQNMLFLLVYLMFPVIILKMLKFSGISAFDIHPLSITVDFYFISSYIGIPILYFSLNPYNVALGILDQFLIFKLWATASLAIFIVTFTFLVLSLAILKTDFKFFCLSFFIRKVFYLFVFLLLFLSFLFLIDYIKMIGFVPIFNIFSDFTGWELAAMRSNATNAFLGKYHWYNLGFHTIPVFLSYVFLNIFLQKRTPLNTMLLIITVGLSIFTSVMNLEKAPLVWYFFGLTIAILLNKKKKFSKKLICAMGALFVILLMFFYSFFMKSSSPFSSIIIRLTTGELGSGYYYLDLFPEKIEFLLGKSFPNPKGIFPWENYKLTVEVMNIMVPNMQEAGIRGTAPTAFWGELYANFGFWGVVNGSILVGFFIYWASYIVRRKHFITPVHIATLTWIITHFQTLSVSGFSTVFVNINLFAVLTLSLLLSLAVRPVKVFVPD